jgi:hypothetical protein
MSAPLVFSNSLIVTPAATGPGPAYFPLTIPQGGSFSASWAWIDQGAGVDLTSTTSAVVFRQVPTDPPLCSVSTTSTAQGGIVYEAAFPNFPWLPPSLAEANDPPSVITIYPFQMNLTPAGVAAITVGYCQWSYEVTWPDGSVTVLMQGPAYLPSV